MSKLTLSDLASLTNQTSAVTTINSNNAAIEAALDNTLSRDGTSPNTMATNLDMNSYKVLNLPYPSSNTEPVRLGDVGTLGPSLVSFPSSVTDKAVVRFSGTTGKAVQSSLVTITDAGAVGATGLNISSSSTPTGIELGRLGSVDSPFLDWHSSGTGSDYDARLIANGGTATPGQGALVLTGNFQISSATTSPTVNTPALLVTPATGLSQGILVGQTSSGTLGYISRSNLVSIGDTVVTQTSDDFYEGWSHVHHVSAGFGGGRNALASYLYIDGIPGVGKDTNGNYVAIQAAATATANAGGTNLTTLTHGAVFGMGSIGILQNGATNYLGLTAAEFNTAALTGSSVKFKSIIQLSGRYDDNVHGSTIDAMIWAYNQASATAKFNDFILIDATNNFWPIATTGNILRTNGSASITSGIDISSLTITGFAFKSTGFSVDGSGNATGNAVISSTYTKSASTVVASLPSAATAGAGARYFVTDANATTFLTTVAGGGANKVPVVSNGTNWVIG